MAYLVMAYLVMAYLVMGYLVMAYLVAMQRSTSPYSIRLSAKSMILKHA